MQTYRRYVQIYSIDLHGITLDLDLNLWRTSWCNCTSNYSFQLTDWLTPKLRFITEHTAHINMKFTKLYISLICKIWGDFWDTIYLFLYYILTWHWMENRVLSVNRGWGSSLITMKNVNKTTNYYQCDFEAQYNSFAIILAEYFIQ